jgi:hypothetical protein
MELSADLRDTSHCNLRPALWFSGHSLTWIRASGADTAGRLSVVERGGQTPDARRLLGTDRVVVKRLKARAAPGRRSSPRMRHGLSGPL